MVLPEPWRASKTDQAFPGRLTLLELSGLELNGVVPALVVFIFLELAFNQLFFIVPHGYYPVS